VQLVDDTLQGADYEKLLARTRVKRGKGARIGKVVAEDGVDDEEDVDVEIYDDTDFYQQMLRDVIDARGRGNGLGGAEDWIAVQKQKKAKKKVDTKASKGRKLRCASFPFLLDSSCSEKSLFDSYEVHEKLQNFMVPVPVQGSWHEEQVDELFASLLGKGFENAGGVYVADVDGSERDEQAEKRLEVELGEALKSGFRVFG
jgi:protein AATF/BFR2